MLDMFRKFMLALMAMFPTCLLAQDLPSVEKPDLHTPSLITPYYFGPNAFPIPDMLDGRVCDKLRVEVGADHYAGFRGDKTTDVSLTISVPVFSDRVCITGWIPLEWYKQSDENIRVCRLEDMDKEYEGVRKGHAVGDAILTTDVRVLTEKKWRPDLTIRIGLHTASSTDYYLGRYYDAPGYYFDTSVGKSFSLEGDPKWNHRVRVAASFGFLCWQALTGRQDDAVMYGFMIKYENRLFSLSETVGGYDGWEYNISNGGDKAHDAPASLKTNFRMNLNKHWELVAAYQYGLNDYPFQQFRIGAAYNLNILPHKK